MADEITTNTNTNSGTNLTLKIFDTDESNPLFNATGLTWAQIVDLWDECCNIYNRKNFKIINSDGTQEKIIDEQGQEITIVSTDALEKLKETAKVYNGAYIGTLTWTYGHDKEHLLQASDKEDAINKFKQNFIDLLTQENYYFSKSTDFDEKKEKFFKLFNIDVESYSTVYQLSTTETNTGSSGNETGTGSSGNETETGSSGNETGTSSSGEGTETGSSGDEPAPSNDTGN